jgi:hypothetical protein
VGEKQERSGILTLEKMRRDRAAASRRSGRRMGSAAGSPRRARSRGQSGILGLDKMKRDGVAASRRRGGGGARAAALLPRVDGEDQVAPAPSRRWEGAGGAGAIGSRGGAVAPSRRWGGPGSSGALALMGSSRDGRRVTLSRPTVAQGSRTAAARVR